MERVAMGGSRKVAAGVLSCQANEVLSASGAKALIVTRKLIAALEALRHPKAGLFVIPFLREQRTVWVMLGLCMVLGCLWPCSILSQTGRAVRHHKVAVEDPSSPPELTQAESAIEKKDYATAEPLLKKVVDRDPKNYAGWFDLGFLYNALGKSEDSISAYRKSVAAKPDVFESNLNLGLMLARAGQPDAEQFLRAATKLKPTAHEAEGRARAWSSLAHVIEGARPDEAIEAYRQAAALQPKDPEPHLAAGTLLEKQNHFADAEQEYKQAATIDPSSGDALAALANLYMRGHRLTDAEGILRKLVALHPNDASAHMQLGRMLAADGQNDSAIAELQSALKLDPKDSAARRDLADLYSSGKKYDQAEAQYRALIASNPNDAELHQGLGHALLQQRKFQEASQELVAAIKLKPHLSPAYWDLAVAANETKNYELAIKALDDRAKFAPEMPLSYFLRATAYDHLRSKKQAAENYRRFLEVADGRFPDQEWQARHRLIAIEPTK
jgi:tetratricopeptide (TPR) repeat protein